MFAQALRERKTTKNINAADPVTTEKKKWDNNKKAERSPSADNGQKKKKIRKQKKKKKNKKKKSRPPPLPANKKIKPHYAGGEEWGNLPHGQGFLEETNIRNSTRGNPGS